MMNAEESNSTEILTQKLTELHLNQSLSTLLEDSII